MSIRPKPPYLLEAQAGDYLGGMRPPVDAAAELGVRVGELLTIGDPKELINRPDIIMPGPLLTRKAIVTLVADYVAGLRQKTLEQREVVYDKAVYIERYGTFDAAVKKLLQQPPRPRLGAGSYSTVFRLRHEGCDYAVRVPQNLLSVREIDKHLEAAARVRGLPNIEQIVAASYKCNVTVAKYVPGELFRNCGSYILYGIPQEAYDELYQSLQIAESRGVGFDSRGSNLMYSELDGKFTMVDVGMADGNLYRDAATSVYVNICNTYPGLVKGGELLGYNHSDVAAITDMLERFRDTLVRLSPTSPVLGRIVGSLKNLDRLQEQVYASSV